MFMGAVAEWSALPMSRTMHLRTTEMPSTMAGLLKPDEIGRQVAGEHRMLFAFASMLRALKMECSLFRVNSQPLSRVRSDVGTDRIHRVLYES